MLLPLALFSRPAGLFDLNLISYMPRECKTHQCEKVVLIYSTMQTWFPSRKLRFSSGAASFGRHIWRSITSQGLSTNSANVKVTLCCRHGSPALRLVVVARLAGLWWPHSPRSIWKCIKAATFRCLMFDNQEMLWRLNCHIYQWLTPPWTV